jgi:hypothetical protein
VKSFQPIESKPARQGGKGQFNDAELALVSEISSLIVECRDRGWDNTLTLIEIDRRWPDIPFKIVLGGHFMERAMASGGWQ